jgi:hypothetical protein
MVVKGNTATMISWSYLNIIIIIIASLYGWWEAIIKSLNGKILLWQCRNSGIGLDKVYKYMYKVNYYGPVSYFHLVKVLCNAGARNHGWILAPWSGGMIRNLGLVRSFWASFREYYCAVGSWFQLLIVVLWNHFPAVRDGAFRGFDYVILADAVFMRLTLF